MVHCYLIDAPSIGIVQALYSVDTLLPNFGISNIATRVTGLTAETGEADLQPRFQVLVLGESLSQL